MRLTIIPSDGTVVKDGAPYIELDLSSCSVPNNVHALQWYSTFGEIEYTDGKQNEPISELPAWALSCVQIWGKADYDEKHPPAPTPEEVIAANKAQAESLLLESDWSVLPDVPLQNKQEWESYRAALRAIVINPTEDPIWPIKPESIWA